ncbi:hypothetical protein AX14_004265 [Amanita brunnescens Koide BX004]|nr:hypothetical protein AX14_004265 [Amanita brunnescens Koide BX004]
MFLVLLLLPLAHAISIHHRLFHPKASSFEYAPRAQLPLDSAPPFSPSLSDDISQQIRSLQDLSLDLDNALYQVALQRDGDQSDSQWDISSVKLCHLLHATSDTIVLHTKGDDVHAIDYFVSPVLHNGACPKRKGKKRRGATPATFSATSLNTTVITYSHKTSPLPELRTPPTLTTDGEPVKPVPEKTFLQKYWMYLVPLLIVLLISGGPEDDQPRRAQ